ncbi:hypothetical protein GM921_05505 [Pedobacter sp. LMG 31464]|uniref:Quinol monooxygenase YgiN n=1 Tax=Pedobacter planticolens TaxID=2679964 RepID=A0A923IW91_9SPHI|nr:hypothetical protein [Pedobacter planticolens]MBB2144927.1 hypothetical protein [Pedobacter planticolens]
MISVKVSYTVKPEFVAQNKQNINTFLSDFKRLVDKKFLYTVYLQEDGLTFLHVSMYENEEVQQEILTVPSFLQFQKERDESGLNDTHKVEILTLMGSSLSLL